MSRFQVDDATPEEIARERETYGPIAEVLRELGEASIRTRVPADVVEAAVADLRDVLARLRADQDEGSYGVRHSRRGITRPWGNAVVGIRNPVAPPLDVQRDPDGRSTADFDLGARFEGPPGLVHGGVSALLLDQLLGEAAGAGGKPGMTARLTLNYRRPTPLGALHGEARIDRTEGYKTWVVGHIADAEGVCVEAEGLFILPRWARETPSEAKPDRFD